MAMAVDLTGWDSCLRRNDVPE